MLQALTEQLKRRVCHCSAIAHHMQLLLSHVLHDAADPVKLEEMRTKVEDQLSKLIFGEQVRLPLHTFYRNILPTSTPACIIAMTYSKAIAQARSKQATISSLCN